jgi:tetratricopeptide (TPR) repeat protein
MCKRTSFVAVLALLALVVAGPGCAPDAFERAQRYKRAGEYTQAEQVYHRIAADQPGTDDALNAQKQLTLLYIAWGKEPEAQKAFEDLIAAFSTHKDIAAAIWCIAREFETAGNSKKALELHQYNVERFPKQKHAMWSQVEIIYYHIGTGDSTAADADVDKLLKVFSTQPTLSKEIYQVAKRYKKAGKIEKALPLYQYNVEHFPKDQYAMWSQVEIIKSHLHSGHNQSADAACDTLLSVFSSQPMLPKEVYQLSREHSELKRYDRALSLDKYNAEHFPNDMYGMLSKVYYHLRNAEYKAADTLVNRLLTEFSNQPALAKEIYQLTGPFVKAGKFDACVHLYKYFLEKEPKDEQALFAQKGLAICYIELGDEAAAEKAIKKLLTGFVGHKRIAEAVYELGMYCYRARKFDRALELRQYNVERFPKEKYAMWSQAEIIKSYIRDGHQQAADTAYEKLLSLFASQPTLATEICRVADTYLAAGNLEKAEKLYTYVLNKWPDNKQILWAKAGMIKLDIARGDEGSAQSKIDNLMEDFKNHTDLSLALWRAAEGYYDRALADQKEGSQAKAKEHFTKVINLGETIRRQLPASSATVEAYFYSAECHYQLGEDQKALAYFQKLVDKWPDYEYAWLAQARVAKIYKRFAAAGVMPDSEVEAAMNVVYERLLANYPDCPAAQTARRWLEGKVKSSEGEQK